MQSLKSIQRIIRVYIWRERREKVDLYSIADLFRRFLEVSRNAGYAIAELILLAMVIMSRRNLFLASINVKKPCAELCSWSWTMIPWN